MTGTVLIIIVSISVIGLIAFFNLAPQIGGKPQGNRMKRMLSASNYRNGKFHNVITTKMDLKSGKMLPLMWDFMKGNVNRKPVNAIQVEKFNKDVYFNTDPGNISFVWFGHSSVLLKVDGLTMLIDPVFSKRASMFPFMGPKRFAYTNHMSVDLLPPVDAVLISHDHYDHLDFKTIKKLKDRVNKFYVPLSVGAHLERWGVPSENIIEVNWWESLKFGEIMLVFTPSRHFSGRGLNNRFTSLWGSWVIISEKCRIFFGGDSGYFPGFGEIGEKFGPFDLTFLECGAYNENWSEIHMMPEETVKAHVDLKGKYLIPIHWGKFSLSLHPWKEPVERATKKGAEMNVSVITPEIGDIMTLSNNLKTSVWWKNYE